MADRAASIGSSITEAESFEDNEKMTSNESSFVKLRSAEEMEAGSEVERQELLPLVEEKTSEAAASEYRQAIIWMVVNTLATIGIVFTNKAIFTDPTLKLAQLTFASFHFFVTWLTLFALSRPRFAMFTPRRVAIKEIAPLAISMSLNVILPNFSLAFSTVTFYQVARIMLTPCVALMNYFLYGATLPRHAILSLIPACLGVGMVSYYDSLPTDDVNVKTTTSLGVIFAFSGIVASSLYTVWISSYGKKLQLSSMQLLFNQAPVSAFLLLYVIPFVDTFPVWSEVPMNRWVMIMMSGIFASILNMSQFFIIAAAGPTSSTVVGHLKTCSIVALGWVTSGRHVGDKSVLGVFVALSGIISYSIIMIKEKTKANSKSASS